LRAEQFAIHAKRRSNCTIDPLRNGLNSNVDDCDEAVTLEQIEMIVDPGARDRQTLSDRCGRHRFRDQSAQDPVALRVGHDTKSFKITNRRLLTKLSQKFLNDFRISESKRTVKGEQVIRFVILVLLGATSCAAAALASPVPFSTVDGRPFVQVAVNGHPTTFLVDTGDGGHNVISRRLAGLLHLKMTNATSISGANAGHLAASHAVVNRFQFGPVVLRNTTFVVADFTQLEHHIGFQLNGIVGSPTLATHAIRFDGPRHNIDIDPLLMPRGTSLPLSVLDGWPVVTARVDGVRGKFLIDTGDRSYLTLFTPFAKTHYPAGVRKLRGVITGFGLVSSIVTDLTRTDFSLGSISDSGLLTRLATQTSGGFASSALAGSIGFPTIRNDDVVLDYVHHRLVIAEIRPTPRSQWDHAGMWLSYGRNAIIVDGVISKSPAAQAGIQPGDQLTSIDGISARSIDLPGLRSRLASAAPGTLRLTVRRNDREEVVVVFPRALI